MLLAKFIEGFIFGIKKTNRLDDNDNVSGGNELLILADQVSTGIKEVEEQLKQAPVLREQNGSNENEAEDVVPYPENTLEKETSQQFFCHNFTFFNCNLFYESEGLRTKITIFLFDNGLFALEC
mgnify:CR=1 FL=1